MRLVHRSARESSLSVTSNRGSRNKVQFKLNTVWHGSIGAGSAVNLNDFAVLDHVPFTGLAD